MGQVAFAFSQSLAYYEPQAFEMDVYKQKEYYPLYISKDQPIREKIKYKLINISVRSYYNLYAFFKWCRRFSH